MKNFITVLLIAFGFSMNAQEVISNGTAYEVKEKAIFKDGVDITQTLTLEQQKEITSALDKKLKAAKDAEKALKDAENESKKAEKAQKQAEKAQRKAEKELKLKQKSQSNYDKAVRKHEQALDTYGKQKKKGNLSPNDEEKWLKKIDRLNTSREKLSKSLRRS